MSLVNRALQDVEKNKSGESSNQYAAFSVGLGEDRAFGNSRTARNMGVGLLLIAGVIYFGQQYLPEANEQSIVQAKQTDIQADVQTATPVADKKGLTGKSEVTEPVIETALPLDVAVVAKQDAQEAEEPVVERVILDSQQPEPQQQKVATAPSQLQQWLSLATQALKADRLTIPEADSAWYYYQQALQLDAENLQALQGKQQVLARYIELIEQLQQSDSAAKALVLNRRALRLQPENPRLLTIKDSLEEAMAHEAKAASEVVNITPSAQRIDDTTDNLPETSGAVRITKSGTAKAPEPAQSKAQAAYTIARTQVANGELAAAVATLISQTPELSNFPEYYALLAGIYQQTEQYVQSARLYNQLTQIQPQSFKNWLGLAISLDNLNDKNAVHVYQRTLPLVPEVQTDIRDYVMLRLTQLAAK